MEPCRSVPALFQFFISPSDSMYYCRFLLGGHKGSLCLLMGVNICISIRVDIDISWRLTLAYY